MYGIGRRRDMWLNPKFSEYKQRRIRKNIEFYKPEPDTEKFLWKRNK